MIGCQFFTKELKKTKMFNIKNLLMLIMFFFLAQKSYAIDNTLNCKSMPNVKKIDKDCNNSCNNIADNSYFSYILAQSDTILGYSDVDAKLNMVTPESTRKISSLEPIKNYFINTTNEQNALITVYLTDGNGKVCNTNAGALCLNKPPETIDGCMYPTPNIMFNYGTSANNPYTLKPGDDPINIDDTIFRTVRNDSMICLEAYFGSSGWIPMGCKQYYVSPEDLPPPISSVCAKTQGPCALSGERHAKGFFPVCSLIVECMMDSVTKVFITGCNSGGNPIRLLSDFQNSMRSTVMVGLLLYVITFGIKIVLGNEAPSSGEVIMFLIKMILVLYFSVGFSPAMIRTESLENSRNGVQDLLLPFFNALSTSLMSLQTSGAGSSVCSKENTLCQYNDGVIKYDKGYEYLAVWDAMDCRMAYYFGFIAAQGGQNAGSMTTLVMIGLVFAPIFALVFSLVFSGQITLFLLVILYAVFLTSIIAYVLKVVVVCIIGGAITAYFAPIFVPMSLFGVTKGFFDGWLKLLFAFALQPVVLVAFVVMMMTAFDQLIFTDCCWQKSADSAFWNLVSKGSRCMNSAGYLLFFTNNNSLSTMESFTYSVFAPEIIVPFFYIKIFCFVFYHMAQSIHEFAAELVGQPTIGKFQLRPMPHMGSIKKKGDKSKNSKNGASMDSTGPGDKSTGNGARMDSTGPGGKSTGNGARMDSTGPGGNPAGSKGAAPINIAKV